MRMIDYIRETEKYRICTEKLDSVGNPRCEVTGAAIGVISIILLATLLTWAFQDPHPIGILELTAGIVVLFLMSFVGAWYSDTGKVCGVRVYGECFRIGYDNEPKWGEFRSRIIPFLSSSEDNAARVLAAVNSIEQECLKNIASIAESDRRKKEQADQCCSQYRDVMKRIKQG